MDHSRAERLRRTVCGVCMVGAPLLLFASDLFWPITHTKAADVLRDAQGSTGRVYAGTLLAVAAMCLMTGAVVGVAHLLHERRPGTAFIGGGLTMVGIVCISALTGWMGLFLAEAAKSGRDQVAMSGLLDDMTTKMWPIGLATCLFGVGFVVLGVGLYRARVVPSWAAICVAAAGAALDIGNPLAFKPIIFAGEILAFVGLGAIGFEVLVETDEEWEHTPEFHGFRHPVLA